MERLPIIRIGFYSVLLFSIISIAGVRMNRISKFLILFICMISLSSCVSREQADAKLARACLAGVKALLPKNKDIGEITGTKFTPSPEGPDFRHVTVNVKEKDGWLENDVDYECTFQEQYGVFRLTYTAMIYQLKFGDKIIGKAGNEIVGSFDEFTKLTDAIRESLYDN